MAKESIKAREIKRKKLCSKYEKKRNELKKSRDYDALQKLPKNSCTVRLRNRCKLTGRSRGYMRKFGVSRISFRNLVNFGLIPGVKKSSW
ncbi:30S ribosomal protein S14 [Candidatus Uzinura diaspidicola str. ASNER]|uniref:Small ribosomal subunit protein uS14 n=1 Tax=Candidatus Uzinura diaspidicola str. ASNER TaxID=1133592 RepID=L7VJR0_9FLAO|nr:30S ribosomal protein S14 [Candidatus Uzinura diaspidicola str. ASNER]